MKKRDVEIGSKYTAKVSGKRVEVRIDRIRQFGGWEATNLVTGKSIRIKTAVRLSPIGAPTKKPAPITPLDVLTDVDFYAAKEVASIEYRLHPIDVGFDLRAEGTLVDLGSSEHLRVSYPAANGTRRVMAGPRADVIRVLERHGFRISTGGER